MGRVQEFFVDCPSPSAWARVIYYGTRVQSLTVVLENLPQGALPPLLPVDTYLRHSVFTLVASTRPILTILPNLRSLAFFSHRTHDEFMTPLLLFLGRTLQHLSIGNWPEGIASAMEHIPVRAPALKSLRVEQIRCDAEALAACIARLTELRDLVCYPASPALILDAASTLPRLTNLTIYAYAPPQQAPQLTLMKFTPGTFKNLKTLAMKETMETWAALVEGGDAPQSLRALSIDGCAHLPGSAATRRLLAALPVALPLLDTLSVRDHSATAADAPLKFDDIKPLCAYQGLSTLYVFHACGVDIEAEEMGEMLDCCTKLKHFVLSYLPQPVSPSGAPWTPRWTPPPLPLTVLDMVATKRPDIETLGLCLNATIPEATLWADPPSAYGYGVFQCLKVFNVSLSPILDPVPVADYLASRTSGPLLLDWVPFSMGPSTQSLATAGHLWFQAGRILNAIHRQRARLLCQTPTQS